MLANASFGTDLGIDVVPKVCYNMVVPKLIGGISWHRDGQWLKIISFINIA